MPRMEQASATSQSLDRARYGLTVVLAMMLVLWLIAGPEDSLRGYLVVVDVLGGALLLASTWSARVGPLRRRATWIGLVAYGLSASATIWGSDRIAVLTTAIVVLLVSVYVPWIVGVGLARRRSIDAQLVAGAITIYLVIGIAAAMAFAITGTIQHDPLFLVNGEPGDGTFRTQVYVSFVTMATVGYGDITPLSGSARAIAIFTALTGQLYLIIAVASAVSMLASTRIPGSREP
jgi:hypothetical protein